MPSSEVLMDCLPKNSLDLTETAWVRNATTRFAWRTGIHLPAWRPEDITPPLQIGKGRCALRASYIKDAPQITSQKMVITGISKVNHRVFRSIGLFICGGSATLIAPFPDGDFQWSLRSSLS